MASQQSSFSLFAILAKVPKILPAASSVVEASLAEAVRITVETASSDSLCFATLRQSFAVGVASDFASGPCSFG